MARKFKNQKFGPEFWDALRRLQAEFRNSKYGHMPKTQWVPTEDIWDYREYDRHIDSPYNAGGSAATVANVDDIAESMKKSGQHTPGMLFYDPDYVDMADEGLFGAHLAEGNHRAAAARQLGRPYYLVEAHRSSRKPNREGGKPAGVLRGVRAKENLRPDRSGYVPGMARPSDFEEFAGSMDAGNKIGSPDDRAIVKAMGNKSSAKKALKAMVKAGKVFGPIGGALGILAGQDPMEAMAAGLLPVEKAGGGLDKRTAKDKKAEKAYYAKKQAAAEKRNPMAKYGKRGSAKRKKK